MKKLLTVKVSYMSDDGFGVATYKSRVIKISNAIPGEVVQVIPPKRRKTPTTPIKIIEESEWRVQPLCPYFNICGGCRWQHIKYEKQLTFKEQYIRKLFSPIIEKHGGSIAKIIKAEKIWRYRNKMEFSFGKGALNLALGLKVFGRFDKVVDLESCFLQKKEADEILRNIKEFFRSKKLTPYDNIKHEGFLRFLVIRTSYKREQIMANIITTSSGVLPMNELSKLIKADSLIWSITDSVADVAMGEIKEIIGGEFIEEELLGKVFRIYPYTFFQTNPIQAEKLFLKIRKEVNGGEIALDLYSGVGVIGIIMAEKFNSIIGIEVVPESIRAAYENAKINDINNIEFVEGKVEDFLLKFDKKADTIFIDPPRAGMHKRAVNAVINLNPQMIVYISCNPKSQARDIKLMCAAGYRISEIQPIDFFPHTPHVENLVILER